MLYQHSKTPGVVPLLSLEIQFAPPSVSHHHWVPNGKDNSSFDLDVRSAYQIWKRPTKGQGTAFKKTSIGVPVHRYQLPDELSINCTKGVSSRSRKQLKTVENPGNSHKGLVLCSWPTWNPAITVSPSRRQVCRRPRLQLHPGKCSQLFLWRDQCSVSVVCTIGNNYRKNF